MERQKQGRFFPAKILNSCRNDFGPGKLRADACLILRYRSFYFYQELTMQILSKLEFPKKFQDLNQYALSLSGAGLNRNEDLKLKIFLIFFHPSHIFFHFGTLLER